VKAEAQPGAVANYGPSEGFFATLDENQLAAHKCQRNTQPRQLLGQNLGVLAPLLLFPDAFRKA